MNEPYDPLFPTEEAPTLSITPIMKEDMRIAARWSQVVAIAGMAINGLLGISMFLVIGVFLFILRDAPEADAMRLVGIFYALFGLFCLFYVYVSVLLYRYSDHLSRYAAASTQSAFEDFFEHQERFWRVFGISLAVFLIFYVLGILMFGLFVA